MDLNLPGINGYEALVRLQQNKTTLNIPVLAVTANAMPTERKKALKAGFAAFLNKPIEIEKFLTTLNRVLHSTSDDVVSPQNRMV